MWETSLFGTVWGVWHLPGLLPPDPDLPRKLVAFSVWRSIFWVGMGVVPPVCLLVGLMMRRRPLAAWLGTYPPFCEVSCGPSTLVFLDDFLGPSTIRDRFCTSGWLAALSVCKCGIPPACFGLWGCLAVLFSTTGPAPGANEDIPGNNDSRDALLFGTFRTVGVVWWERGVAVGLGLFGRDLYCSHPSHPFHLFRQPVACGTLFVP